MPLDIISGSHVQWAEGAGRVVSVIGDTLNKAAGAESDAVARVRLFRNGQATDEVALVPVSQLEKAAGAAPPDHGITADSLDAHLAKMSDHERAELATAWFAMTGPKLPTIIVGSEGVTVLDGVDQGGNAMPQGL